MDLFEKMFGYKKKGEPVVPTTHVPWTKEAVLLDRRGDPWELREEAHLRTEYYTFIERMQKDTGRSYKAIVSRLNGVY